MSVDEGKTIKDHLSPAQFDAMHSRVPLEWSEPEDIFETISQDHGDMPDLVPLEQEDSDDEFEEEQVGDHDEHGSELGGRSNGVAWADATGGTLVQGPTTSAGGAQEVPPSILSFRDTNAHRARAQASSDRREQKYMNSVKSRDKDTTTPRGISAMLKSHRRDEWIEKMAEQSKKVFNTLHFMLKSEMKPWEVALQSFYILTQKRPQPPTFIPELGVRLVADGSEEVNEFDVYAPTAASTSILMAIVHCVLMNWELVSFDIGAAFLSSDPNPNAHQYMMLPRGFDRVVRFMDLNLPKGMVDNPELWVGRIKTQVYGTKGAMKGWGETFNKEKVKLGFEQSEFDAAMHIRTGADGKKELLVTHVDDTLGVMSSNAFVNTVEGLRKRFKVHKVNKAESFLGWQAVRNENGYGIHHGQYIRALVDKHSMKKLRKFATPGAVNLTLGLEEQEHEVTQEFHTRFREILGALQHCQRHTRPDISAALNALTRKAHKPNNTDMAALERVVGYLNGTADLQVIKMARPAKSEPHRLHVFTDASLMDVRPELKASTGYMAYLGGNLLAYGSKSTAFSPDSSFLAETVSLIKGYRTGMYLFDLWQSLDYEVELPILMYCDNQAAILNLYRGAATEMTRHTMARSMSLRSMVAAGVVEVLFMPTKYQLADILTKNLAAAQYLFLRGYMQDPRGLFKYAERMV